MRASAQPIVLRAAETPRSGNRLAHVAWVTRVCIDHLRRGDVRLCDDEPKRLCWKCHKLQPVTAFEVCSAPRCAAQRPLTWLYSTRQGARRTCIEMMLKHNLRRQHPAGCASRRRCGRRKRHLRRGAGVREMHA